MDQLTPAWRRDYERLNPPHDLPYWLGKVLMAPTEGMPTQEDYQAWLEEQVRQDPDAIQPVDTGETREMRQDRTAREVGQVPLDYLTMAHGIASLLKGGTGAAQELMGKRRGQETFGKEMIDTSRRAQPQKWRETERENWQHTRTPDDPGSSIATSGREGYERGALPPQRDLVLPKDAPRPRDVVQGGGVEYKRRGDPTETFENGYTIGAPVELPSGAAQYVVTEGPGGGYRIRLKYGDRLMPVTEVSSIGEALAKARQLQNRLALAAQDLGRYDPQDAITGRLMYSAGPAAQGPRRVRLPWERGTSFGEGPDWPRDYSEPPGSGRWSK